MTDRKTSLKDRVLPWGAGAGFALGQITLASRCTVPLIGKCAGCAGCVIALASLVGWASLRDTEKSSPDVADE